MIGLKHPWLYIAIATFAAQQAASQQCYYPNGGLAPVTEKPCSTEAGSACCPDDWICLDNGLCHYPVHDLYERYSCTDKSWDAPGCPSNLCTYGGKASGAESITQCSNHSDDWCCNADAQHVNCCQELPVARPFFALKEGRSFATIGLNQASYVPTLSTITGIATSTEDSGSQVTSQPRPSIQASISTEAVSSRIAITPDSIDPRSTSLNSGSVIIETFAIPLPTASSDTTPEPPSHAPQDDSSRSQRITLIAGCIVGIIIGLAVVRILAYKCQKRRRQAHPYVQTPETKSRDARAKIKHWSLRFLPELEGDSSHSQHPVPAWRSPVELEAGTEFRPGVLPSRNRSAILIGSGTLHDQSKWGSAPPRYPRATRGNIHSYRSRDAAELDGTSVEPSIEKTAS